MDWPELVQVAKRYGFVEFHEGHRMYNRTPLDLRRIYGGFSGAAEIVDFGLLGDRALFRGPYDKVAEYLRQTEKEKRP